MCDIFPIDARHAGCLTVKRTIAISCGTDGRYKERVFDRVLREHGSRYHNGTNYLDALLGGFNWEAAKNAGFDPDAELKVYAIPDNVPLFRWVLRDGTVVTTPTCFSKGDFSVLNTFDGQTMLVPTSNVAYITGLKG